MLLPPLRCAHQTASPRCALYTWRLAQLGRRNTHIFSITAKADSTMGTNTSSPASHVDQDTSMSGLARMGGAQPRNKATKAAPSPPAQSTTTSDRARADRPSVDTLPPYQAAHTQPHP